MPRSCRKTSTLRSESGDRTHIITARRIISGLVWKDRKGPDFVIRQFYAIALPTPSQISLKEPSAANLPSEMQDHFNSSLPNHFSATLVRMETNQIVRPALGATFCIQDVRRCLLSRRSRSRQVRAGGVRLFHICTGRLRIWYCPVFQTECQSKLWAGSKMVKCLRPSLYRGQLPPSEQAPH
jgi:hypothetical protein